MTISFEHQLRGEQCQQPGRCASLGGSCARRQRMRRSPHCRQSASGRRPLADTAEHTTTLMDASGSAAGQARAVVPPPKSFDWGEALRSYTIGSGIGMFTDGGHIAHVPPAASALQDVVSGAGGIPMPTKVVRWCPVGSLEARSTGVGRSAPLRPVSRSRPRSLGVVAGAPE
ncbi:MAG: hypothetical protein ACRDTX_05980 [Pseudonocardiaceae bacterium]